MPAAKISMFSCDITAPVGSPERIAIETAITTEFQKHGREVHHPLGHAWLIKFNDGDSGAFFTAMTALRDQHPTGFKYVAVGWDPSAAPVAVAPPNVFDPAIVA
jgi:hypothetical protein